LVKQAVGFNALRGDSVNVVNAPFEKIAELEPLPEPPLWEQPWVMTLGKQILGGLVVLLLLLGVLRPVMRNLATYAEQKKTVQALEHQQMADDQVTLSGEQQRLPRADGYEANLNMAKGMVQQDPKLVAQVIKNWVANG
jgi:flagellar M-ring protein FliF